MGSSIGRNPSVQSKKRNIVDLVPQPHGFFRHDKFTAIA